MAKAHGLPLGTLETIMKTDHDPGAKLPENISNLLGTQRGTGLPLQQSVPIQNAFEAGYEIHFDLTTGKPIIDPADFNNSDYEEP